MTLDEAGGQAAAGGASRTASLQCKDCTDPIAPPDPMGFCRRCGAPLCKTCASKTMTSVDQRTVSVPLVVVSVSSSTTVEAQVAVCARCAWDKRAGTWRSAKLAGEAGLAVWLAISLPIIAASGLGAALAVFAIIGMFAIFCTALFFFFFDGRVEAQYRPACPVCGQDAMPFLLRWGAQAKSGRHTMPNYLECSCGYKGARVPLDGLSKFVAKHGVGPLSGSPLKGMAEAALRIGSGRAGTWKMFR